MAKTTQGHPVVLSGMQPSFGLPTDSGEEPKKKVIRNSLLHCYSFRQPPRNVSIVVRPLPVDFSVALVESFAGLAVRWGPAPVFYS